MKHEIADKPVEAIIIKSKATVLPHLDRRLCELGIQKVNFGDLHQIQQSLSLNNESQSSHYLIFIDYSLFSDSLNEALSAISSSHNKISLIVLTPQNIDRDSIEAQSRNIFSLSKPYLPSSLMSVILKAVNSKHQEPITSHVSDKSIEQFVSRIGSAHILVVEDNLINQEITQELLRSNGMQVTIANNGLEATQLANEKTFDAILMDCQMPIMDGYEATQKIRQLPQASEIPIIAMTANAMAGDREKEVSADE
ncbi:sensory box histidine kinase [Vibrio sp. JCM 19236]|nr:sensory box histidine kinase [Vibrio sp. JCM 19236]